MKILKSALTLAFLSAALLEVQAGNHVRFITGRTDMHQLTQYQAGKELPIAIQVQNIAADSLKSFAYTYSVDGNTPVERTIDVTKLGNYHQPNWTYIYYLPVGAIEKEGFHSITLALTKRNGVANDPDEGVATSYTTDVEIINPIEIPEGIQSLALYPETGAENLKGLNTSLPYQIGLNVTAAAYPELKGKYIYGAKIEGLPEGIANPRLWASVLERESPNYPAVKDMVDMTLNNGTAEGYYTKVQQLTGSLVIGYQFDVAELNETTRKPVLTIGSGNNSTLYVKNPIGGYCNGWSSSVNAPVSDWGIPKITVYYSDQAPKVSGRPAYSVSVSNIPTDIVYPANFSFTLPLYMHNSGTETVTVLDGTIKVGDVTGTFHRQALNIAPGTTDRNDKVWVNGLPSGKYDEAVLTITKVNDMPNECPDSVFTFPITLEDPLECVSDSAFTYEVYDPEGRYQPTGSKHIELATLVKDPQLTNARIVAVENRFLCMQYYNFTFENMKFWSSSKLTAGTPDGEIVSAIDRENSPAIHFTTPVTIPEEGVYIGFEYDFKTGNVGSSYGIAANQPGGEQTFMYRTSPTGEWEDRSATWGSTSLRFYIEGETADGVTVTKVIGAQPLAVAGETFKQQFEVKNFSGRPVKTLTYHYEGEGINGEATDTLATPLASNYGMTQSVILNSIAAPSVPSIVKVNITKVNGHDNAFTQNPTKLRVNLAAFRPVHRPIMEEGTGPGCGWCPRGVLAIHLMKKLYPDFICAAYQSYTNDPMMVTSNLPWEYEGFPSCTLDHSIGGIDPYFGTSNSEKDLGILDDYEGLRNSLAPCDINLETQWNDDETELTVNTTVQFGYVEPNPNYRIAYLATLDGISHPELGEAWIQYSGYLNNVKYADNETLRPLYDGSLDLNTYNHVVVDVDGYKGVNGSLPSSPEINTPYTHQHVISFVNNNVTKDEDLSGIKVIAMVLDKTGRVVNARDVDAGESTVPDPIKVTNIKDAAADANALVEYYDLQGRRISNPQHGIFIKKAGNKATKIVK